MSASIIFLPIALICAALAAWAGWRGYKTREVHVLDWFNASRANWPVLYWIGMMFWAGVFSAFALLSGLMAVDIMST